MGPRAALRSTLVAFALAATAVAAAPAPAAQPLLAAPPASQQAVAQCGVRAAQNAATADVERVVRGIGTMGGCVTDLSGIAHLFIEWRSDAPGGPEGRICVDPPVRASAWECAWDTTVLEPGSYTVTMTAVDAAGNRGGSEQAYRVAAPAPTTPAPTTPDGEAEAGPVPAEPTPPAPGTPTPVEPAPTPPAATDPARPTDPAPPAEPAAPVAPVDPAAPADPEPDAVAPAPADPPPGGDAVTATTVLEQLVLDRVRECARLELAPGVLADRALSLAVLECLRPALEGAGATSLTLDEIPVPPAIRIEFADAVALGAADELLPDRIGGVELQLVLAPPEAPAAPAPTSAPA